MTNEVPISDVVISAVPPPSVPAPHSTKRKLDAMGETEGNSMEPAKQLPRSESSTVQVNPNELHSIPLNNDNTPIISGMAPVADTSAATATSGGDAVINITDDGTEGQPQTQPTSGVADKILFGFDRVLDAAQYPVDTIKSAGIFVGEGVVKVAEEVVDTVKDGLAVAGLGATVVKDALVEVAVQTNLALRENFGKAVAAGELAVEKAEEKIVHLSEVVTGHRTPNPVPSTSATQPGAPTTETANLATTTTTLIPDQGIVGAPATTVKPGLSTSSTFSQQHDAASQWHADAEKHQNVV